MAVATAGTPTKHKLCINPPPEPLLSKMIAPPSLLSLSARPWLAVGSDPSQGHTDTAAASALSSPDQPSTLEGAQAASGAAPDQTAHPSSTPSSLPFTPASA